MSLTGKRRIPPEVLLTILERRGGHYRNPLDDSGRRIGPFVGYAGRGSDGEQKVGDEYFDFAVVEETEDLSLFAETLAAMLLPELNALLESDSPDLPAVRSGSSACRWAASTWPASCSISSMALA